jgi:uncharacterized membrane protein YoaK (UPF0700 family)
MVKSVAVPTGYSEECRSSGVDPNAQRSSPLRRSARSHALGSVGDAGRPLASAQSGTHVIGAVSHGSVRPPRPVAKPERFTEEMHTAALSSIAGFVEASAFLGLFGLFPAHITGALVWASSSAATPMEHPVLVRLTVIPTFFVAVLLAAIATRVERRRCANPLPLLMSLMTFSLAMFCVAGVTLSRSANDPGGLTVALIGGAGVFAMGIQNAIMRDALNGLCLTTMMTGNLTQLGIEVVNFAFALRDSTPGNREVALWDARQRLAKFGAPVSGFTAGAVSGAFLTHTFGLVSVALPTFVCAALSLAAFRKYR